MNAAIHAAVAASKSQQPGVDEIVRELRNAHALSATSAVTLPGTDSAKIDEALGLGLIIRSSDGRLHVNEIAVADRAQSQGWIVMVVLLIGASVAASIVALLTL